MTRDQRRTASIFATNLQLAGIAYVLAIIFIAVGSVPPAQAQTITVLHSFTGGGDGSNPVAGVTLDRAGNLYGTASGVSGGRPSTVFKLSHVGSGWVLNTLYTFNHPGDPTAVDAPVVFGPDGALYGTSYQGGQSGLGTVFSLRPPASVCHSVSCPWTPTVLHSFSGIDGKNPDFGDLVFDSAGNVYGTTSGGGAFGHGTVFRLTRSGNNWTHSVVYNFTGGNDGASPENGVVFDGAGNLYGTTYERGSAGFGTVYELSPDGGGWTETTLYTFTGGADGANPIGSVAIDTQGNLYGTAAMGGTGAGTAWELSPSGGGWIFTLLHSFSGRTTPGPSATPTLDAAGNLYGTSPYAGEGSGFGEAFKLTPTADGWTFTAYEFDGITIRTPYCRVAVDASGNLYGTSVLGGTGDGGAVWEITP